MNGNVSKILFQKPTSQKTGVAFIGGNAPPTEVSALLAKNADIVVAADSGLLAARRAGIAPDRIVGDMDSLPDDGILAQYPAEKVLRYPRDKDLLDTEIALNLLREKGCRYIVLAGGGGGRLDHLLALRALFDRPLCPALWVTDGEAVFRVDEGGTLTLAAGRRARVSVLPAGRGPWKARSAGLKWPLDGLAIRRGWTGISNETEEDGASVTSLRGRFLVMTALALIG